MEFKIKRTSLAIIRALVFYKLYRTFYKLFRITSDLKNIVGNWKVQ